jgi:hypothetical protein
MRVYEVAKMVGGSIAIYIVMAACSAARGPTNWAALSDGGQASTGGGSGSGGTSGGASRGGSDGSDSEGDGASILDALTDPVSEAQAQSLPPITATENCDKSTPYMTSTSTYAEHAFPGYTAQQLARVVALATYTAGSGDLASAGYTQVAATPQVRDGYVALWCGLSTGASIQSVTFILPQ